MGKVQRLGVETIQSIHTHESKGIISVVGNNKESYMKEIWKKVVGFENYEVSNKGKVRNNHKTLRDKLRNTDDFVEYRGYKFKNNN